MAQDLKNLRQSSGTQTGHMLPETTEVYDLGSAEKKVRHLFLSDSSIWIGDNKEGKKKGGCYFCMDALDGGSVLKDTNDNYITTKPDCLSAGGHWLADESILDRGACNALPGSRWQKGHKNITIPHTQPTHGTEVYSIHSAVVIPRYIQAIPGSAVSPGDIELTGAHPWEYGTATSGAYSEFKDFFGSRTYGARVSLKDNSDPRKEYWYDFKYYRDFIGNIPTQQSNYRQRALLSPINSAESLFGGHTQWDKYSFTLQENVITAETGDGTIPQENIEEPVGGKYVEGDKAPEHNKKGKIGEIKVGNHAGKWFLYVCVANNLWGRTPLEVGWDHNKSFHGSAGSATWEAREFHFHVFGIGTDAFVIDGIDRLGPVNGENPSITIDAGDIVYFHVMSPESIGFTLKDPGLVPLDTSHGLAVGNNNPTIADPGELKWTVPLVPGAYSYIHNVNASMTGIITVRDQPA